MPDPMLLLLAGGAGVLLGVLFFGGLWWTVQRALASRRPALWFVGSFVLRTSVVLAGMYVVSGGRWEALLACLAGLVAARVIVTRLAGPPAEYRGTPAREADHAPESR
ncbi:MAG: ATP synthase subunit I [Vicinamibacterales bacterium]